MTLGISSPSLIVEDMAEIDTVIDTVCSGKVDSDYQVVKDQLISYIKAGSLEKFASAISDPSFDWNKIPAIEEIPKVIIHYRDREFLRIMLSNQNISALHEVPNEFWSQILDLKDNELMVYLLNSGINFWAKDPLTFPKRILSVPDLPLQWYKSAFPQNFSESLDTQYYLAKTETLPRKLVEYLVNETNLGLGPLPVRVPDSKILQETGETVLVELGQVSYAFYAGLVGNSLLRSILLSSPRYVPYIQTTNTKIEFWVKAKLDAYKNGKSKF